VAVGYEPVNSNLILDTDQTILNTAEYLVVPVRLGLAGVYRHGMVTLWLLISRYIKGIDTCSECELTILYW
jgi:hypothetical protein